MIEGDVRGETGYGISMIQCDNQHPIIVVDSENKRIGFALPCHEADPVPTEKYTWTFEQYIELTDKQLEEAFEAAPSR